MRTYEILTRTTYGESMVDSMLKGIVIALGDGTFPTFSYKLLSTNHFFFKTNSPGLVSKIKAELRDYSIEVTEQA